jgi:hypothetical protein
MGPPDNEDVDDVQEYANKHNNGVPLEVIPEKDLQSAATVTKLYNQFQAR